MRVDEADVVDGEAEVDVESVLVAGNNRNGVVCKALTTEVLYRRIMINVQNIITLNTR